MKSHPSLLLVVSAMTLAVLLIGIVVGGPLPVGSAAAFGTVNQDDVPDPPPPATTTAAAATTTTTTTAAPTTTATAAPATATTASTTTTSPPPATTTAAAATTTTTITTARATTTTAVPVTTTTTTTPPPTTTTAPARVVGYDASAESRFVSLINGVRSGAGLPALSSSGDLHSYARGWAKHMGETGTLAHSNLNNVPGPWQSVGENVGFGPTVDSVFSRLVASSGHYATMVNPTYTDVGVGVWVDADGTLWVAQVFRG